MPSCSASASTSRAARRRRVAAVPGLYGAVADHRADHHLAVGQFVCRLLGRAPRVARRCRSGPASGRASAGARQRRTSAFLDSSPSRSRARICRLSSDTSRVSAATVSSHRCACSARVGVTEVRSDVGELAGEVDPHLELVRPPVGGQCGVESIGEDGRITGGLRVLHRGDGERRGAVALAGVGPAAGERGAEQRAIADRRCWRRTPRRARRGSGPARCRRHRSRRGRAPPACAGRPRRCPCRSS